MRTIDSLVEWFGLRGGHAHNDRVVPGESIPLWIGVEKKTYVLVSLAWTLVAIGAFALVRWLSSDPDWYGAPLWAGIATYALGITITERLLIRVPAQQEQ